MTNSKEMLKVYRSPRFEDMEPSAEPEKHKPATIQDEYLKILSKRPKSRAVNKNSTMTTRHKSNTRNKELELEKKIESKHRVMNSIQNAMKTHQM